MISTRELFEALVAGKSLINALTDSVIRVDEEGELVNDRGIIGYLTLDHHWRVVDVPDWCENIPPKGILCWVDSEVVVIKKYNRSTGKFMNGRHSYANAIPMVKEEIYENFIPK